MTNYARELSATAAALRIGRDALDAGHYDLVRQALDIAQEATRAALLAVAHLHPGRTPEKEGPQPWQY